MTEPEGEVIIINQYCTSARDNYNEFISHEAILRMRSCAARGTVHTVRSDVLLMLQVARHFSLLTRNQNRLDGVLVGIITYLQSKHVLVSTKQCPCGTAMILQTRRDISDGCRWRCPSCT